MLKTHIADEEVLYRCVKHGRGLKKKQPDGTFRLSGQAFADPHNRPSVNRAKLCDNDPKSTQFEEEDGVVSLVTLDIRLTDNVVQKDNERIVKSFQVDVEHVPEPKNYSHAEIFMDPESHSKGVLLKFMERLAYLANQRPWEIEMENA